VTKILQIGAYLAPNLVGGAEVSAREIAGQLRSAGCQVIGFSSAVNNERKGAKVVYSSSIHRSTALARLTGYKKYLYYLLEQVNLWPAIKVFLLIKRARIDLVLVHSWRGLGEWLPTAVLMSGRPVIFVLPDFAFVCLNKGARRNDRNCSQQCLDCGLSSRLRIALARRRNAVCFVAPSAAHAEAVKRLAGGALDVTVIHNPNKYTVKSRTRLPVTRLQFGYVGRLEEDKGFSTFLALARKFADRARFVVAGEGAMVAEAEASAASGYIRYLGQVSKSQICDVYDSLDALLVPSKWRENFPGVCVEALLSGLPVIGSAIGGIPEIIKDQVTGRLLPPDDIGKWEQVLEEIVSAPALIEDYSRNALSEGARFDPAASLSRYRDLVRQMTAKYPRLIAASGS